ncbi:MAG: hypothetical protein SCK70_12540 [bacterium]|nr:hypothetical protein [bacterium]
MVYLGAFCLFVSMVGLYVLLFSSFSLFESEIKRSDFVQRASRKIRIRRDIKIPTEPVRQQPNPRFVLLVESILIGEVVGLFFLALSHNPIKFKFLAINAALLLLASFLCSVLTLFNAWFRKKTMLPFRIILQASTLIIGLIIFRISMGTQSFSDSVSIVRSAYYMRTAVYAYYITVVVAIGTMLYVAIKGSPDKLKEFDFNNYLIMVIMSGLVIGSGLLLIYSIQLFGF